MSLVADLLKRFGYVKMKRDPSVGGGYTGYAAAQTGRIFDSWNPTNLSADAALRYQLYRIRARSRDLAINNAYIKKFIGMVTTNVLGHSGINFQSKVKFKNGDFDKKTNALIEEKWDDWGKKKNSPDVSGKLSWRGIQRLILRTVATDGEILIRKICGFDNPYKFSLQLIDADHLDEFYNAALPNGNQIRMGVEIDPWGKPVAYWVWKRHPYDYLYGQAMVGQRERIPAEEIIHQFVPLRINQRRGVPWAFAAMAKTNVLDGYEEAELVAARVAAAKMGFFETDPSGVPGMPIDGTDSDGKLIVQADPGTFWNLPPGKKLNMFKPEHPTTAYEGFVKQVIRALASGLEVSYNSLSSDLEAVNFSSIRSGTLEERDNWKAVQGWFIEDCCEQIWLPWLEMAVMTQQLPYSIYDLGRLNACKWQGRSWSWVDPLKDQKANSEGIATGLSTRTDIANEQGKDFFEMIDTIAEEEKYIKEKGLTFVFPGKGTAQPPEGKPNEPVTPTGEQPTGEPKGVDAAAAKMKVIDGGKRSLDIAEENEGG